MPAGAPGPSQPLHLDHLVARATTYEPQRRSIILSIIAYACGDRWAGAGSNVAAMSTTSQCRQCLWLQVYDPAG